MQSMDLTEVRVRGKRPRKQSSTPASGSSSAGQSRKRTRKHVNETTEDPSTILGTSPLERLPTELLEIIFLKCLNINLPRASLSIGKRLASDHVKTELFYIAFSGAPVKGYSLNPGYEKCLPLPLEAAEHLLGCFDTEPEVAIFQYSLLALRWMTPWALRRLMNQLSIRKTVRLLQHQNLESFVCEQNNTSPKNPKSLAEVITELYESVESNDQRWLGLTSRQWKWVDADGEEVIHLALIRHQGFPHMLSVTSWYSEDSCNPYLNWEAIMGYSEIFRCLEGCRIAQKVLHGPWDVPKCTMLAQLSKADCDLDRTGATTDEEVADNGLRAAIMQPSIQAIVTLVGSLRGFHSGCSVPECDDYEEGDVCCTGLVSSCHVGINVDSGHLKLALAEDSSIQVLECLLDAISISVDWKDNHILAWIVEKRREGDPRGQFVFERYFDLLHLERSPSMTYERRKELMSPDWINSKPSWLHDEDYSDI